MKNYYEILGISENSTNSTIERAYNELVSKYHPENFTGEAKTLVENKILDIKEAYSILSDDFLRSQYDKEIGNENIIKIENSRKKQKKEISNETIKNKIEKPDDNKGKDNSSQIGSMGAIIDITKEIFLNFKNVERKKLTKKSFLSMLAAITIVLLLCIILWFIPFTNSFIRSMFI